MEAFVQSLILLVSGFIAGSYGSVVGGGGLVSFPVLILLGFPVDVAIGTNRFNAVFMEGSSLFAYTRKKLVQWKLALPIALLSLPFAIWGANLAINASEKFLNIFVAITLFVLFFLLQYVNPQQKKIVKQLSSSKTILLYFICLVLAIYAGFHGVAYGTFILFPFLLLGTSSLLNASANARLIGFVVSIAASYVFIQNGTVDFAASVPQIIGSVVGAQVGVKIATKHLHWIKYALSAVVIGSIVKLLLDIL